MANNCIPALKHLSEANASTRKSLRYFALIRKESVRFNYHILGLYEYIWFYAYLLRTDSHTLGYDRKDQNRAICKFIQ